MSEDLPIQPTAHHASDDFGEFEERTALTPQQRLRFSDYGTKYTVPRDNLQAPLIAEYSRGLADLNRPPTDSFLRPDGAVFRTEDFARPTPNQIWLPGMEPTEEERGRMYREIYEVFHNRLLDRLRTFTRPGIVVAWDNTAHYEISNKDTGETEMMKPFILSNRGTRGSVEMSDQEELNLRKEKILTTSCDPRFLEEFAIELRKSLKRVGLPDEVFLNLVYKGGYMAEHYNTRRHPEIDVPHEVQSFQVEYDTLLTHPDQENLQQPNWDNIVKIRLAFERALTKTYVNVLTHTVGFPQNGISHSSTP